jgi:dCMP deaminase
MTEINKWDRWFLDIAKVVSTKSKDPSTGIGAVIADTKNRLVSVGYNGYPRGVKDEGMENREEKLAKTLHAEQNAIIFAQRDLTRCTIYVYPLLPCSICMAMIIQSGITRVVSHYGDSTGDLLTRWEKSNQIGLQMAKNVNMKIVVYGKNNG